MHGSQRADGKRRQLLACLPLLLLLIELVSDQWQLLLAVCRCCWLLAERQAAAGCGRRGGLALLLLLGCRRRLRHHHPPRLAQPRQLLHIACHPHALLDVLLQPLPLLRQQRRRVTPCRCRQQLKREQLPPPARRALPLLHRSTICQCCLLCGGCAGRRLAACCCSSSFSSCGPCRLRHLRLLFDSTCSSIPDSGAAANRQPAGLEHGPAPPQRRSTTTMADQNATMALRQEECVGR